MSIDNGLYCVLHCDDGYPHLWVSLAAGEKGPKRPGVILTIQGKDLKPGNKAFHVHECGNLSDGCKSLGPHYNPTNNHHGDLNDPRAHHGDLGNIHINSDGDCNEIIYSRYLSIRELVGRSLVLHANTDDLGLGGTASSRETGNSGARICCGVIGYA